MSRSEIWRLTVFTEAALVLLVALSVWIGQWAGSRGIRDVAADGPTGEDPGATGTDREDDGPARPVTHTDGDGSGAGPAGALRFGVVLLTIYAVGWLSTDLFG